MKKLPIRLLLMFAGIALVLGATHRQLHDFITYSEQGGFLPEGQSTVVVPEGGIHSNAFSLKFFHEALASDGNVCISPMAMQALLHQLYDISGDATRKLLDEQVPGLNNELAPSAATMQLYAQLFVDNSLDFTPEARPENALRVPLREDFTRAIPLINGVAEQATDGFAVHMLDAQPISGETSLLALSAARFQRPWLCPFHLLGIHDDRDFYHADGSIRPVRMMACRDVLTVARAEDGSWEAVALFFLNEGRSGSPACFVAILPAEGTNARSFARELTAEKLSDIRRQLAMAAPRELTVVMPQLELDSGTFRLQPLLLRLGLGKLFTKAADFSRLCSGPLQLDLALGKYTFVLDAKRDSSNNSQGETLRLNRPFIWYIGDLTTANPPCFMGLME